MNRNYNQGGGAYNNAQPTTGEASAQGENNGPQSYNHQGGNNRDNRQSRGGPRQHNQQYRNN